MKKFVYLTAFVLGTFALLITSCQQEEEVLNCDYEGIKVMEKVYGTDSAIIIHPVMTINNYDFCDSMIWDPASNDWVKPSVLDESKLCTQEQALEAIRQGNDTMCPCRINEDTLNIDKINSYFYIGGIEKFPYNKLYIKIPDDTVKVRRYTNYDNDNNLFQGYVATDMSLGYYKTYNARILKSGIYEYELILYKDENLTVPFDTISDKFVILTARYKDKNKNCADKALESNDPLLN
ncbi:MAG: hypothetical protein PF481_09435 [Bacteroidales bacterium]|jgi:hypothetical protein|nr:hypothetical protein [Bacteroidales bacterium]